MADNRKNLIDYLPLYMQQYAEMVEIMDTDQIEIDAAWRAVSAVWGNQFVTEADEGGVERFEAMFHISPKATDTLDERKFRILSIWTTDRPYTITKLREILTTLCGEDFEIILDHEQYQLTIKLGLANQNNYDDVVAILTRIIPANLTWTVMIMFNKHQDFSRSRWTHEDMGMFNHQTLREGDII